MATRDVSNPDPNTGLQGSDATTWEASSSTTLGPVNLSNQGSTKANKDEPEEVDDIKQLIGRAGELEKQPTREEG